MEKGNYENVSFLDWEIIKLIPHVEESVIEEGGGVRHWHTGVELMYFWGGDSKLWINGKDIYIKDEGIALINNNEPHRLIEYETAQTMGYTIIISYEYLRVLYKNIDQCYFILDEKHPSYEKLKEHMKELLSVYQSKDENEFYYIKMNNEANGIIYLLLTDFRVEKGKIKTQRYEERYRKIISYIEEHYKENIKMEQAAEIFGFSREYFSRSFKKYMNINFKEYLTQRRLVEARRLLMTTDQKISDIALESGFSDIKAFYAAFKKQYGKTPNIFRK